GAGRPALRQAWPSVRSRGTSNYTSRRGQNARPTPAAPAGEPALRPGRHPVDWLPLNTVSEETPRMDARRPRVVLVHDWLTGMRGGEKCLERLCRRWPNAPLLTLLHAAGSVTPDIEDRRIRTSFLQRLPGSERYYRYLLPLLPLAARWPVPPCDLVFSLSHCVAKAARPPRG